MRTHLLSNNLYYSLDMESYQKRHFVQNWTVYLRVAIVTVVALCVTYAILFPTIALYPMAPELRAGLWGPAMVIASFVPIFVAVPVALVLQRDRVKLAQALHQLHEMHEQLEVTARTDGMTGLLNREAFVAAVKRATDAGDKGAVLMIDADHFKLINDTYGHPAGDRALQLIAQAVASTVRPMDIVGRLGGEEFGVYIASSNAPFAMDIAERIRLAISRIRFEAAPGVPHRITASIGVAIGTNDWRVADVMQMADRGLYVAKGSGRNQIQFHQAA